MQRQPTALPARDKKDSLLIWSETSEGQQARTNVTLGLIPALCRDTQVKQSDFCHLNASIRIDDAGQFVSAGLRREIADTRCSISEYVRQCAGVSEPTFHVSSENMIFVVPTAAELSLTLRFEPR